MTIEKAIDQLDWYFQEDDGLAAEKVTKEAYETLKRIAESKENQNGRISEEENADS